MLSVKGLYKDGKIQLEEKFITAQPVWVIVTFLEELAAPKKARISLGDFSFPQTQKLLGDFSGSFSDDVVEERREEA